MSDDFRGASHLTEAIRVSLALVCLRTRQKADLVETERTLLNHRKDVLLHSCTLVFQGDELIPR